MGGSLTHQLNEEEKCNLHRWKNVFLLLSIEYYIRIAIWKSLAGGLKKIRKKSLLMTMYSEKHFN